MTKDDLIQERLGQIHSNIESQEHAIAMLLPNENEQAQSLRDNDCDIQFTLIVKQTAKQQYLRDLSWLTDIQHIAYQFCRRPGQFRFLFSDGIYCDLTVIDEQDAEAQIEASPQPGKQKNFRFSDSPVIKNSDVVQTNENVIELYDSDWLLSEMLTNILIGLRRYAKGDKLSAFYLIQHHALSRLLELIERWEAERDIKNSYVVSSANCFEHKFPKVGNKVADFALGYEHSPQSAYAMLKYVEQHNNINYFLKDQLLNLIKPHSNLH